MAARGRLSSAAAGISPIVWSKWFTERACDGFVVAGTHMPGSFASLLLCRTIATPPFQDGATPW